MNLSQRLKRFTVCLCLVSPALASGASPYPFVPQDFTVPATLEQPKYRLRKLTVHDVIKDYDAVMSSAEHIQGVAFPASDWPSGLTLEDNLIDLGWHQREFDRRTSFAYTVVTSDESRVIGCVYINPTRKVGYDAVVHLWTRPPEQLSYLDEKRLRAVVAEWLAQQWPFKKPAMLGGNVAWDDYSVLPEAAR
ncbi:MAG: GNAT family N-acetyltransferase [Pseudomonadota bacterium]